MNPMRGVFFVCLLTSVVAAADMPNTVPATLHEFVSRADDSYQWEVADRAEVAGGKITEIRLVSQTWQDMAWKHDLLVIEPATLRFPEHVLLYIGGGNNRNKPKPEDRLLGVSLAGLTGTRVAMLFQVPNQPLLGGRFEDDLITDTFLFHLATRDARWPLLFPMVKSAKRAMDCLDELAAKEWSGPLKGFVVSGASKRGWTTWLTGAVDPRVRGIAPIVIDTLNMPRQMDYQIESWGKYSEQIIDYERKGLIRRLKEDEAIEPLWRWVDPYTYRKQLALPKLIVNGTNDRYWTVDALNIYWDDLVGEKYIRYVPNAGHSLKGGREGALVSLAAFTRHVALGKPLPELKWNHDSAEGQLTLTVQCDSEPIGAHLWVARSDSRDFRESQWVSQPFQTPRKGELRGAVAASAKQHTALFGEIQFQLDDLTYSLCTQLRRE